MSRGAGILSLVLAVAVRASSAEAQERIGEAVNGANEAPPTAIPVATITSVKIGSGLTGALAPRDSVEVPVRVEWNVQADPRTILKGFVVNLSTSAGTGGGGELVATKSVGGLQRAVTLRIPRSAVEAARARSFSFLVNLVTDFVNQGKAFAGRFADLPPAPEVAAPIVIVDSNLIIRTAASFDVKWSVRATPEVLLQGHRVSLEMTLRNGKRLNALATVGGSERTALLRFSEPVLALGDTASFRAVVVTDFGNSPGTELQREVLTRSVSDTAVGKVGLASSSTPSRSGSEQRPGT